MPIENEPKKVQVTNEVLLGFWFGIGFFMAGILMAIVVGIIMFGILGGVFNQIQKSIGLNQNTSHQNQLLPR
jgi:hypothetical protein